MTIAGLVKSSLIDYPGKVSAVIFTQGCNFRCGFCHNPSLIPITNDQNTSLQFSESEVLEFLGSRVGKLDGVVITGGEPTIQPDLVEFIKKIKKLGFLVKLDTNGSRPDVVRAVQDAATRGLSFGAPTEVEIEMAETLVRRLPSIELVRLVSSGTEATMSALRLARGFTGRPKIVKFEGCYHGHADSLLVKAGSGALTFGQPSSAGVPGSSR